MWCAVSLHDWSFLDGPLPALTRSVMDAGAQRQPGHDPKIKARQNAILIDLFAEAEAEQARMDALEAAVTAAHHARERARRNGKGRSRAAQRRRAEHARLAEWCEPCRAMRAWGESVVKRAHETLAMLERIEQARWNRRWP